MQSVKNDSSRRIGSAQVYCRIQEFRRFQVKHRFSPSLHYMDHISFDFAIQHTVPWQGLWVKKAETGILLMIRCYRILRKERMWAVVIRDRSPGI